MGIDNTEELLKKFDYTFLRKNDKLIIKLDFSQRIIIDFTDPEKIKITDKLVGWNFLTGIIEMSIKNATLYNFIWTIIIATVFVYLDQSEGLNLAAFFLVFVIFWVLFWFMYYLIKAENLKRILISWNA
ncbi:hypothetical protein SAMN00777080_1102 [Aquiflexum balticum DSM 16537]|uniref:Uncharacterized protein n=1 Tax=Aquiflexum balticum DSM 16537 TaxID=758820 RepID=A0A1W2H1P1_9BACT|nr:hypothetical protein [Aquiflexum balticum]SMD42542.1 hypothetical protein SAMN00777080_1102 [Aquiflexum balticum DSM 16537]